MVVASSTNGASHAIPKASGFNVKEQEMDLNNMTFPVCTDNYGVNPGFEEAEWRTRVDLAAAFRLCHSMSYNEGVCNHLTAEVPGHKDRFLVSPYGLLWNEVTASSLLVVDMDGNVLDGEGQPEATAFWIHSRLHAGRPGSGAVFHTHQAEVTALTCLEDFELPMVHQNSLRFWGDVAYERYGGLVLGHEEGARLARTMGSKRILLHQNHEIQGLACAGIMVCAETVAEAFDAMYYLEQAARITVKAMSTGRPLKIIDDEVAKKFRASLDNGVEKEYARIHFEALKRELLRGPNKEFVK